MDASEAPTEVYVSPAGHYAGSYAYIVLVDGKVYDSFTSKGWLTHAQMIDVAAGYREGLTP